MAESQRGLYRIGENTHTDFTDFFNNDKKTRKALGDLSGLVFFFTFNYQEIMKTLFPCHPVFHIGLALDGVELDKAVNGHSGDFVRILREI